MGLETIILLALIQGITEFLPISSSAHLMLFPYLFNIKDQGIITDIFAHFGSLLAVMYFYRKDLKEIILSFFDEKKNRTLLYSLIIASLPILILGLIFFLFKIEFRNPKTVIYTSIIFGLIFYIADKIGLKKLTLKKISIKDALYIGLSQMLSAIPGVSRSGITTTSALFLGYKRDDALKFSFLLSIPTIIFVTFGGILKFVINPVHIEIFPLVGVMIFSFIFSIMTIKFIMLWLRHCSFKPFAIYRIILGVFLYLYLK
ncbi:MAG: undecaprenyl-diphosphate phosphatase [Alphaproteobacteria bacterium]|nr:undecaprenyl-diphosphate phosphatase [Alphaproteobacteria bacterium]